MQNYGTVMDLIRSIGIFPIPPRLSITNIIKGYLILFLLFYFFKYNFFFVDVLFDGLSLVSSSPIFETIRSVISQVFWKTMVFIINKRKIRIVISGVDFKEQETLEKMKNCIIVSNHRSLFDHILIHYLKTMVEDATNEQIELSFFSWGIFWKVPGVGLLYKILSNDENWEMSRVQLDHKLQSLASANKNNWFIHFPEVNIYTRKNRLVQNQQTEKFFVPKFNQLLYPRFSNFNHLITSTQSNDKSKVKYLLDLSLIYFNPIQNVFECPTLFEILTLKQPIFMVHVDFKIKPISKLPYRPRKLERWLELDWIEKEKILEEIQRQLKIEE